MCKIETFQTWTRPCKTRSAPASAEVGFRRRIQQLTRWTANPHTEPWIRYYVFVKVLCFGVDIGLPGHHEHQSGHIYRRCNLWVVSNWNQIANSMCVIYTATSCQLCQVYVTVLVMWQWIACVDAVFWEYWKTPTSWCQFYSQIYIRPQNNQFHLQLICERSGPHRRIPDEQFMTCLNLVVSQSTMACSFPLLWIDYNSGWGLKLVYELVLGLDKLTIHWAH